MTCLSFMTTNAPTFRSAILLSASWTVSFGAVVQTLCPFLWRISATVFTSVPSYRTQKRKSVGTETPKNWSRSDGQSLVKSSALTGVGCAREPATGPNVSLDDRPGLHTGEFCSWPSATVERHSPGRFRQLRSVKRGSSAAPWAGAAGLGFFFGNR
jgi:hypothetical protein